MWDFVRHSELGLLHLIEFLNGWARLLEGRPHTTTIRYEDLRSDPETTLRQVMTLLGDAPSDAEIEDAVRFGSFDNLRALEGMVPAEHLDDLRQAMGHFASAATRAELIGADVLAILDAVETERGAVGRFLSDRELFEDLHEAHRILKSQPWTLILKVRPKE